MNKILLIVMMSCTSCFGQIAADSIVGNWYLGDGCIPKKMGAWATYPTASAKFCFSKTKSTGRAAQFSINANDVFIENVSWTFSSGKKGNILVCEYLKEIILSASSINGKITTLETKEFVKYKNKYFWDYNSTAEVLKIFDNKKLTSLLVAFIIGKNKESLTLIKP